MKTVPAFTSDEEAETFLGQDLSDLDVAHFKPIRFAFERKSTRVAMRLPDALLEVVRTRARERGMPFARYIRDLIERDLASSRNP